MPGGDKAILVTGLPRSGTSWVGKMLEASGDVVYINEPLNPQHPPGLSPGVLGGPRPVPFQYIAAHNGDVWEQPFRRMLGLRYDTAAELKANRSLYDLGRMAKYLTSFNVGRVRRQRPLVDDPYALMAVRWLVETMGIEAIVLVREPLSYVGSRINLGWKASLGRLLDQPELMADLFPEYDEALRSAAVSDDEVHKTALLWAATYHMVHRHLRACPGVHIVRYEDLASEPIAEFEQLYESVGLAMTSRARKRILLATTPSQRGESPFSWSLRFGVSRTAFRPMSADFNSYKKRLTSQQIDLVWNETSHVRGLFYAEPD